MTELFKEIMEGLAEIAAIEGKKELQAKILNKINNPEKLEEAEETSKEEKKGLYQVVRTSKVTSSLGDGIANIKDAVVYEFKDKDKAEIKALALNKTVLPEEKGLLGTEYIVKEI